MCEDNSQTLSIQKHEGRHLGLAKGLGQTSRSYLQSGAITWHWSRNIPKHLLTGRCIYNTFWYIYLSIYLSIWFYLSVCLSVYLYAYLSIYLSIYRSIYRSIDLSIYYIDLSNLHLYKYYWIIKPSPGDHVYCPKQNSATSKGTGGLPSHAAPSSPETRAC